VEVLRGRLYAATGLAAIRPTALREVEPTAVFGREAPVEMSWEAMGFFRKELYRVDRA